MLQVDRDLAGSGRLLASGLHSGVRSPVDS